MAADYVMRALSLFETARQKNPYLYFELAYTKATDWMCWVIDKQGGERNVLFEGQADNPNEACCGAITVLTELLT